MEERTALGVLPAAPTTRGLSPSSAHGGLNHPYAMTTVVLQFSRETVYGHLQTEWEEASLAGDKNKTLRLLAGKSDEMVLTVHRWFANKSCPGDWLYSRLGDLASKVTAALGGSSSETAGSVLYRVRKSWSDAKSQKGAFNNLDNAKKCADSNAGYSVFDESGKVVYTGKQSGAGSSTRFLPGTGNGNRPDIRKVQHELCQDREVYGERCVHHYQVKSGTGSTAGWGKLKSGAGWISLITVSEV